MQLYRLCSMNCFTGPNWLKPVNNLWVRKNIFIFPVFSRNSPVDWPLSSSLKKVVSYLFNLSGSATMNISWSDNPGLVRFTFLTEWFRTLKGWEITVFPRRCSNKSKREEYAYWRCLQNHRSQWKWAAKFTVTKTNLCLRHSEISSHCRFHRQVFSSNWVGRCFEKRGIYPAPKCLLPWQDS